MAACCALAPEQKAAVGPGRSRRRAAARGPTVGGAAGGWQVVRLRDERSRDELTRSEKGARRHVLRAFVRVCASGAGGARTALRRAARVRTPRPTVRGQQLDLAILNLAVLALGGAAPLWRGGVALGGPLATVTLEARGGVHARQKWRTQQRGVRPRHARCRRRRGSALAARWRSWCRMVKSKTWHRPA